MSFFKQQQLSIRAKLFIFLCTVSLLPLFLSLQVLTDLGGNSFNKMINYQVRDGLDQTERALSAAEERLSSSVTAVSRWKDLVAYFNNPDSVWVKDKLASWAPLSYKLDYLALCDPQGRPLYQWNAPEEAESRLLQPFFDADAHPNSGWISTPRALYLLSSSNVVSQNKNVGIAVFGRKLTYRFLLDLNTGANENIMVYYGGKLLASTDTSSTLPYVDPAKIFAELVSHEGTYVYEDTEQNAIIGFRPLANINGIDVAALGWSGIQAPARFMQEAIHHLLYFFGIPLLVLVLLAAVMLGGWIEKPIRRLSRTMEEIRTTGDLTRRAPISGGGEIGSMSRSFNQMLEQLAKQHEDLRTFQTMILTMKEGVLIEDTQQNIIYMNPRLEEMLGGTLDEIRTMGTLSALGDRILTKGQRIEDEQGFFTEEVEWIRPDGRRLQALKTASRLVDHNGNEIGELSTYIDISERNDLEIELIEASRMAFLGLYTQGVIHNINGPLNTILGFSALLCKKNPEAEIPQRINTDAQRIAEQIALLGRRWQRTGLQQNERLNLNEIILDEMKFLEADLFYKHNVEKDFDLDPNLPAIEGRYGDFSHALLNIISNAIDAMQESPIHKLTIRTRFVDEEILVKIEDTGVGINPEDINRIFLPFFSTKRRNLKEGIHSGAGLGLAITRKVLEPYAVRFDVQSEIGRGTTIILHIPLKKDQKTLTVNEVNVEELV